MNDELQRLILQQQAAFSAAPMSRDDVRKMFLDLMPPWILQMDRTPPSTGGEVLGFMDGAATWGPADVGGGGTAPVSAEWSQSIIAGNKFSIAAGPAMWSNVCLNTATPMVTMAAQEVSYGGVVADGDVRYLYVEIKLSTTPDADNAVVVLGDNGYFPVDNPGELIVRWPLSKWSFTVADDVYTATKELPVAWAGGRIHLVPTSFGPPLA